MLPLSLYELKDYLGVDQLNTDGDVMLNAALNDAVQQAQNYIGKQNPIVSAVVNPLVQFFGDGSVWVKIPAKINPVVSLLESRSVTSVTASDYTAIASNLYEVMPVSDNTYVLRYPSVYVPGLMYRLTYTSGFALQAEIQTLYFTGNPAGGTFTLSFGGYSTTALAWNASASAIQTALQALTSIGSGNILCTGSLPSGVTMTFAGTLALGIQNMITGTSSLSDASGNALANDSIHIVETQAGVATAADFKTGLKYLAAYTAFNSDNKNGGKNLLSYQNFARNFVNAANATETVKKWEDLGMLWQEKLNSYRVAVV